MSTESSDGEEEGKQLVGGIPQLTMDEDLREMGKKAAWSVSSCKPSNGVSSLREDNVETYWQSDDVQPHLVKIAAGRELHPSKITIRAGDGFLNLKQECMWLHDIKTVELVKPTGWVYISLSGNEPWNLIPHQPFQFTSREFITYSCVR